MPEEDTKIIHQPTCSIPRLIIPIFIFFTIFVYLSCDIKERWEEKIILLYIPFLLSHGLLYDALICLPQVDSIFNASQILHIEMNWIFFFQEYHYCAIPSLSGSHTFSWGYNIEKMCWLFWAYVFINKDTSGDFALELVSRMLLICEEIECYPYTRGG